MRTPNLRQLFLAELKDIYNAEHQIIDFLPHLIKLASLQDLKEALTSHLKETKEQVRRLEKIFSILGISPQEKICEGIEGLFREAEEMVHNQPKCAALDAAIIACSQKVEHYEIAAYGTLRSFAEHLELESIICDLLQDTLDEEAAADKKLTKIADGSFFSSGINKEAAEAEFATSNSRRR